jgi:hypothetical protein
MSDNIRMVQIMFFVLYQSRYSSHPTKYNSEVHADESLYLSLRRFLSFLVVILEHRDYLMKDERASIIDIINSCLIISILLSLLN